MLPFINLQLGELRSFDAQQGAPGLLPDGADALDGDFADILHVRVAADDDNSAAGGDFLQSGGRDLPLLPLPGFDNIVGVREALTPSDKFARIGPVPLQPVRIEEAADVLAGLTPGDGGDAAQVTIQDGQLPQPLADDITPELVPAVGTNPVPTIPTVIADEALPATGRAIENALPVQSDTLRDRGNQPRGTVPEPATLETSRQLSAQRSSEAGTVVNGGQVNATQASANRRSPLRVQPAAVGRTGEPAPLAVEANDRNPESVSRPVPAVIPIDEMPRPLREDVAVLPRPQQGPAQHTAPVAGESALLIDHGPRTGADTATAPPRLATAQLLNAPIALSVQESGWDRVISERVLMMANGRLQNAEIRLTPAELGPLRIQVAIEDGMANVAFQAQHAVTREAIELAMPRLRELMAENGLTLGHANVSDDGVHQGGRDEARGANAGNDALADDSEQQDVATQSVRARVADGLVDTFA